MARKITQTITIDGELIDWYRKKYTDGNLSGTINQLLKNFLYVSIDENVENLEQELEKMEKKRLDTEQKIMLIKNKLENAEKLAEEEQNRLKKANEEAEEAKIKCIMCGELTSDQNRMELSRGKLMHRTCFNAADAKTINSLLLKIKEGKV